MSDLKAQLEISADASGVEAGVNKAKRSLADLGSTAKTAGRDAGEGLANVGQGGDSSAKKVDAATKSMIQSIQRTIAVMEAGSRSSSKYFETLATQRGVDPALLKPYTEQLDAVVAKQKLAEQAVRSTDPAVKQLGMSAAATAAALRGVPAQFTDIVTSLQGGQKPLTVLLQQGGQLKDMFGGVGNAASAIGGYVLGLINPFTIAAGAAAVLAIAYEKGSEEADAYSKALILSGNAAGATASNLDATAKSVSKVIGTQGAAANVLAQLAENGNVAANNLEKFTVVALEMEKAVGKATSDTVKELADLAKAPLAASEKLNEQYHYLTASVYEQIKALQDQGKADEAGEAAQKAYAEAFDVRAKKIIDQQGTIERAWGGIKDAAKGAWDAMLDIGRSSDQRSLDSVSDDIKVAQSRIREASKPGGGLIDVGLANYYKNQLQDLLKQQEVLQKKVSLENDAAVAQKKQADLTSARIKWDQEGDKFLDRRAQMEKEITAEQNLGLQAGIKAAEIETRIGEIRKKYSDIFNDGVNAQIEALKRRSAIEDALAARASAQLEVNNKLGLIDNDTLTKKQAELDLSGIDKRRSALVQELELTKEKQNSLKEQQSLIGQIAVLDEQRLTRANKLTNDLALVERQRYLAAVNNYADQYDKRDAQLLSLRDQIEAQKEANAEIGKSSIAVAVMRASELDLAAAQNDSNAVLARTIDLDDVRTKQYEELARKQRELASLRVSGSIDTYLDPNKAQDFGDALVGAFEEAGNALAKLDNAFSQYGKRQRDYEAALTAAAKERDEAEKANPDSDAARLKYAERIKAIDAQHGKEQIATYASMAGAAKGFFEENSKGYKVLQGAEDAFRAYQLASDLVKGASAAAVAVANQAQGDPYTAWARMAAMAAAMAALGFAVTGGFNSGSGGISAADRQKTQGTGTVFGDAEAKSESVSKSLDMLEKNSNIALQYSSGMLAALRSIDASMAGLANIVLRTNGIVTGNSLGVFEGTLSKNTGDALTKMISGFDDSVLTKNLPILGNIIGNLQSLWGKTTQQISDSGLSINGTIGDLSQGKGFGQYTDVTQTSSSFFGLKKDTSSKTVAGAVDAQLSDQFALIFKGLESSLQSAAGALGLDSDTVGKAIDNFAVNLPKLSLRGLKGQELTDAINNFISTAFDNVTTSVLPGMQDFEKVGEGYFETVIRVASGFESASAALERLGITAIKLSDVVNKQGDVATEVVRQSIMAKEIAGYTVEHIAAQTIQKTLDSQTYQNIPAYLRGRDGKPQTITETIPAYDLVTQKLTGIGEIMQDVSGSADDLINVYKQLLDTQRLIKNVGIDGSALTRDTIKGAGDLGALNDALTSYFENFFSPAEQAAKKKQNLADQFGLLGLSLPTSKDAFRALVGSIDKTSAAGQELFGKLILLSDAFADVDKAVQATIDTARSTLQDAYNRESSALQSYVDKFGSASKSLHAFLDSLLTGPQSPLSTAQQTALNKSKFDVTSGLTKSSDKDVALQAMGDLQSVSQAYLTSSMNSSATIVDYARSVGQVMAAVKDAANNADAQVSVAQLQLNALDSMVSGILDVDKSVISVHDALIAYFAAVAASNSASGNPVSGDPGQIGKFPVGLVDPFKQIPHFAIGTDYVPYDMTARIHAGERIMPAADNRALMERLRAPSGDNNVALVAEVKQLRAELQAQNYSIARNTGETAKILRKFDGDGTPPVRDLTV